jgi:hypothetical protein
VVAAAFERTFHPAFAFRARYEAALQKYFFRLYAAIGLGCIPPACKPRWQGLSIVADMKIILFVLATFYEVS